MTQPGTPPPNPPSLADPGPAQTPILAHYPPLSRNRNFLLLWLGYVISALGDRIHFVIMLALLVHLKHQDKAGTQDTAQLNVMMLIPFLLLGPFTGSIADRLPRRAIMVVSDFTRSAIVLVARTLFLAVPPSLHANVPGLPDGFSYAVLMLLASELLIGAFSAFFSPARNALMPNLVHPDQLLRANSMTNSAGTIASLVGFVIGGAMVSQAQGADGRLDVQKMTIPLFVDMGTFFTSGVLLLMMKGKNIKPQTRIANRRFLLAEFADGIRYLRHHKRAVQVILLMFLFWCCGAIILSGLTGVVTKKFGLSEAWYAYFMGIVGVGMMLGAASCALARRGIPKEFGIAWAMIMVGIFFFAFSIPQNWVIAVILLNICAFFGAIMLVSLDTLLQRIVPDFTRGRVMAVRDMLANVGLVGMALPLAFSSGIDDYIILILRIVAVVVTIVGIFLLTYYYRRQPFPVMIAIARRLTLFYLAVFKKFDVANAGRIPISGPVIFVSNHTTAYDPVCLQAASKQRLIQFMMAKEYYLKKPLYWAYRMLKVIPVNRTGNDTASIRTALRALADGSCIGMFPEGGISDDGRLLEGRQGVALLALMSGATVVPAYIKGTTTHAGMVNDFLKFDKVTLYFGRPLRFDDLGKGRDETARDTATQRIMAEIIRLRDKHETNPERRISSADWAAAHPEEAAKFKAELAARAKKNAPVPKADEAKSDPTKTDQA